jgi:hypothetical protein
LIAARRRIAALALVAAAAWFAPLSGARAAGAVDWDAVSDVEEVKVLSTDEDGDTRETTVWLAVVDGQGYIRTGGTTWGDNVVRDPEIALRIEGREIPLRAVFIEDEALRARVEETFREKYGWSDGLISWIRGTHPKIMRLDPR